MLKRQVSAMLAAITLLSLSVVSSPAQEGEDHAPSTSSASASGNALCPVTEGEPVDPEIWTLFEGQRVNFCCQDCKRQFIENPEAFRSSLQDVIGLGATAPGEGIGGEAVHDRHGQDHAHAGDSADSMASTGQESSLPTNDGRVEVEDHPHTTGHEHPEPADERGHEDEATPGHDHATGHAQVSDFPTRLIRFAGKFHPPLVHFPIALILMAALAEFGAASLGRVRLSEAAFLCLVAGAVTAVAAAGIGWAAGSGARFPQEIGSISVLWLHRWLGVGTAILSTLTVASGALSRRRPSGGSRGLYRTLLFLSAVLVGATGHFGAALVFGLNHFTF